MAVSLVGFRNLCQFFINFLSMSFLCLYVMPLPKSRKQFPKDNTVHFIKFKYVLPKYTQDVVLYM